MNRSRRCAVFLAALAVWPLALSAQIGGPPPGSRRDSMLPPAQRPDSARMAMFGPAPDPVGFLLEHKDSLRLTPDVVQQLVAINLDLFRRNARVQRGIDSILPAPEDAPGGGGFGGGVRPGALTPEQRERLQPLMVRRNANIQRARDAAWELLTPDQRARAERMEARNRQQMQRDGRGRRPG